MMRIGWNSEKKKVGIGRLIDWLGVFKFGWLVAIRLAHLFCCATRWVHKNPAECARLGELCVLPTPCAPQDFSTLSARY